MVAGAPPVHSLSPPISVMEQTTVPRFASGRIVYFALLQGVVLIWAIAYFLTSGGAAPFGDGFPISTPSLIILYLLSAVGGLAAALHFRRKSRAIHESARSTGAAAPSGEAVAQIQTNMIISWAILEGAAIVGAVLFLIAGPMEILYTAAVIYVIGLVLTAPRREWYGE